MQGCASLQVFVMSITAGTVESKLKEALEAEVVTVVDTSGGYAPRWAVRSFWGDCLPRMKHARTSWQRRRVYVLEGCRRPCSMV